LILARLLDEALPQSADSELIKNIYYLCVFKVFEDEADILHEALNEIGISEKTKMFIEANLKYYKHFMESDYDQHQLVEAAH
jgi:hypothetical protein